MSLLLPIPVSARRMSPVTLTAGQTQLTGTFPLQREADVTVIRSRAGAAETLELGNDYEISGLNQAAGFTVTLTVAALAGDQIELIGNAVLDRTTSVTVAGKFSSRVTDKEFDRLLMIDQELRRDSDGLLARALRVPEGEEVDELPAAAARASRLLGFDGTGQPLALTQDFGGLLGNLPVVTSRVALASLATTPLVAFLSEGLRSGFFRWTAGNLSAFITADTQQAIYVAPASDTSGASGAWVRDRPSGVLLPQWAGAAGDAVTDDTTALQKTIDLAEKFLESGGNAHIHLAGLKYLITNELSHDSGIGLEISDGMIIAGASANWTASPHTAADLPGVVRTNLALWCRDLTNAAWTKTNMTAAKTETGIDGAANSATKLTATAANATATQAITSSSAVRLFPAFVKRVTGTGNIQMTLDNGGTWTTLSPAPSTTNFRQYKIPVQTLANPTIGFRVVTSGDAIIVDFAQLENIAAGEAPIATPPILTTTAAATRQVSSKYLLTVLTPAQSPLVRNVQFDCANQAGGVYFTAFSAHIDHCRFDNIGGIGIRQDQGGCRITHNLLSQSAIPSGRTGIGIFAGSPDGKFFHNICRYLAAPAYLGDGLAVGGEAGSTGLWSGNHFYNGDASGPDSTVIYIDLAANSNIFVGNYLDSGKILVGNTNNGFWSSRCAWSTINNSAASLFAFFTETAADTLVRFNFGGLVYPKSTFASAGATVFGFLTGGAGTWNLDTATMAAFDGSAWMYADRPQFYANDANFGEFHCQATSGHLLLKGRTTTLQVGIGVDVEDLLLRAGNAERLRISSSGVWSKNAKLWNETLKTANETRSSTTSLADDATLTFAFLANKSYQFLFDIYISTPAAADFKCDLNSTAAAVPNLHSRFEAITADGTVTDTQSGAFNTVVTLTQASGALQHLRISALLYASTNNGTFSFRWAQNTSDAGSTIVRKGTTMMVREID